MSANISELPRDERPISEQFRLVAKAWCDLDGAARLLEETKSASLSQMMKRLGDIPAAHAERDVKASPEWGDYIKRMVDTRTKANLKRVQLKYLEMRHREWIAADANARSERKL